MGRTAVCLPEQQNFEIGEWEVWRPRRPVEDRAEIGNF